MLPMISLVTPTREDVQRLADWLDDDEMNSLWYGRGQDGLPLHIGYSPHGISKASDSEWRGIFEDDENRKIYSVYTEGGEHIGEGQLVIEWALREAQVFLLIGRKDMWHQHYGTMALVGLLDQAFESFELHRVWGDVPEYNEHALDMFRQLGFVLEGHLRKTHRKDEEWYDSFAMGLLTDEYVRRRSRLLETLA